MQPIKLYLEMALEVFSRASLGMRLEKRNKAPTTSPKNEIGTPAMFEIFEYVAASQLNRFEILHRVLGPPSFDGSG
jgi:hypothetical protein